MSDPLFGLPWGAVVVVAGLAGAAVLTFALGRRRRRVPRAPSGEWRRFDEPAYLRRRRGTDR